MIAIHLKRRKLQAASRRGTSAMETVLLLAAIGLPLMVLIFFGIRILAAHYTMVTTLNALPIG